MAMEEAFRVIGYKPKMLSSLPKEYMYMYTDVPPLI